MIFASLGTMNIAFNRMAKAVDEWAAITKEEVIVQTGYTDYPYKHAKAFKFCTKEQMKGYISRWLGSNIGSDGIEEKNSCDTKI